MGISPNFDDKEFFELLWLHTRLAKQKQKEIQEQKKSEGKMFLSNQ